MSYVFEKYSAGGGGGTGSGIIEVDSLPTENIDENAVYRVPGYSDVNVYCSNKSEDVIYPLLTLLTAGNPNATVAYYVVDRRPNNPLPSDLATYTTFNVYIENDIPYFYGNAGAGEDWVMVSDMVTLVFAQSGFDYVFINKGYVSDIRTVEKSDAESRVFVTYQHDIIGKSLKGNTLYYHNGKWVRYYDVTNAFNNSTAEEIKAEQLMDENTIYDLMFVQRCTTSGGVTATKNTNLKKITIPQTIIRIGMGAFVHCCNLTEIVYLGTKEQWRAITKYVSDTNDISDPSWDKDTGDYTIYCTDGTIAKDGTET